MDLDRAYALATDEFPAEDLASGMTLIEPAPYGVVAAVTVRTDNATNQRPAARMAAPG